MSFVIPWADDVECLLTELRSWQARPPAWLAHFHIQPLGLLHHSLATDARPDTLLHPAPLLLHKQPHDAPQFLPMLQYAHTRYGYWFDEDGRHPSFVVSEAHTVQGTYRIQGRNLLDALRAMLESGTMRGLVPAAVAPEIRAWIARYATAQWSETEDEYLCIYPPKAQRARQALAAMPTDDGMGILLRSGESRQHPPDVWTNWQQAQNALYTNPHQPNAPLQLLQNIFAIVNRPILTAIAAGQQTMPT